MNREADPAGRIAAGMTITEPEGENVSETLTDGLRRRLAESTGVCPTCGQPTGDSLRQLAANTGVHFSTLHRFLRGGAATSRNLDKIAAYLSEVPSDAR
jgi:hypothetical protein